MKLALVGASGVVGRKILQILEKKNITFEEFYPLGSSTVGEIITFHGIEYTIQDPNTSDASSTDVAILAAGSTAAASGAAAGAAAAVGTTVAVAAAAIAAVVVALQSSSSTTSS